MTKTTPGLRLIESKGNEAAAAVDQMRDLGWDFHSNTTTPGRTAGKDSLAQAERIYYIGMAISLQTTVYVIR